MAKRRYYAVTKDGMWFVYMKDMGVREFIGGELRSVPTVVWTDQLSQAMTTENRLHALNVAKEVDGEVKVMSA